MTQKMRSVLFLTLIMALFVACGSPAKPVNMPTPQAETVTPVALPDLPAVKIVRHPAAADYSPFASSTPTLPAQFDPNSGNPFQNDYRSTNLSKLDLSQSMEGLLTTDFDSKTTWPPAGKLPPGFDPQKIMELGKDPGLGVRQLHAQGLTGAGVGIAIIDQPMLVDHQEYKSQLRLYEEINIDPGTESQMHGPAVASIAVGKTVGVAPAADLYFIADWPGTWVGTTGTFNYDFSFLAKAVRRVLEINQSLPAGRKIRVISISVGWRSDMKGYADMVAAVDEAKRAGIFVISMSIQDSYGWNMIGMGRNALADPNDFGSYTIPVLWSGKNYNPSVFSSNYLLIPMDARTTASPTGTQDYVFYSEGGLSWTAPYLAGVYALACQVDPKITPEEFWSTAIRTGKRTQIEHDGKPYAFGVILDPQAVMATLHK